MLMKTNVDMCQQAGQFLDWKKTIHYPKGTQVCFHCQLPFFHDKQHRPNSTSGDTKQLGCMPEHIDVVTPVVYIVYWDEQMHEKASLKFGVECTSDLEFSSWLAKQSQGQVFTNMMCIFLWIVEQQLNL